MNSTHIISDNFRPTQALNSRKVYVSFKVDSAGSGSTATPDVSTQPDDAAVSIKMTTALLLSMLFAAILLN